MKNKIVWIILGLFLLTRVILLLVGGITRVLWYDWTPNNYSENALLDMWGHWDSKWYVDIAENGYSDLEPGKLNLGVQMNYAFFPLYPLLMKIVSYISGNEFISGIVISNICFILACYFLYKLVELEKNKQIALLSVWFLIFMPLGFLFSSVLTDSLFIFLAVLSFYLARQKKWWWVGVVGMLLALCRPQGILLVVPLVYEYLAQVKFNFKKINWSILSFSMFGVGLIAYMILLYYKTGDPLAFIHIQSAWNSQLKNPFEYIWQVISGGEKFRQMQIGFGLLWLVVFGIVARYLRVSYIIFSAILFVVAFASGSVSIPRYLMTIFPIYIGLGSLFEKKSISTMVTSFVLIFLQIILMVFWVLEYQLVI